LNPCTLRWNYRAFQTVFDLIPLAPHRICPSKGNGATLPQGMTLDFRSLPAITTQADFSYSITPDSIFIIDTGKGRASVRGDIEAVLRKIEYRHQDTIAAFKIICRDEAITSLV
jgi:hypothetical protein